jgi:hypothetical protein
MRKGFEGLNGLVRDHLGEDPMSGHLVLFTNRSQARLRVVVWDGIVGMREALGERPLPLAAGGGGTEYHDASPKSYRC